MDPYKFLHIKRNADGSLTRPIFVPLTTPSDDPSAAVLSRDVPLDPSRGTWLRLFLPTDPPASQLLPVLTYFHGGGFILFSAASAPFHDSCCQMARKLPALVVSVEYRLAPEHRLPAAYDDAVDAVRWLRRLVDPACPTEAADPWLRGRADFSRCFLAGSSSGGNIAYHAARRLLVEEAEDLRPVVLRGLVLNQPYFGGAERTPSEAASAGDRIVPLAANDLMWELSLPEGDDRDHVFCNPMIHHRRRGTEEEAGRTGQALLPRCLVRGYLGDPLIDRQREFAAMLEEQAAGTVALLDREGFHAVELFDSSKAELLIADIKQFLSDSSLPWQPPPPESAVASSAQGADPVCPSCKY
ncbi:hypothetical protein Taro_030461 [Colocasia esculenta]|uniref:Alpha/beta hydrolase fold-3 domain-containing protein n=1 Tax=Colocasia esculenta TaxID=4460 RepID=A0A843VGE0_COLES|nr:hypothetical protein [Colocasia esculenta]